MRVILFIACSLLFAITQAQDTTFKNPTLLETDSSLGNKNSPGSNVDTVVSNDETPDTVIDRRPHNKYGDLIDDDKFYNPKYAWWKPAVRVVMANAFNWSVSKYIFHYDWADINTQTWKNNLKHGWVWDDDHFGTNFIGHPHSGNIYFNIARSNGYSFWESIPFAVEGSLMWEYFGENTLPSKNDLINTPFSGMFLGEVVYRISSNILDDRARGANRVWREIVAGIINPPRALNRLTQGKMFRVTQTEVYQQEPLNITISGGLHQVNKNNKFGTGTTNYHLNLQLDYGDPFEVRRRKAFDIFRVRTESTLGINRKFLDNVTGYGFLFGNNIVRRKNAVLIGGFQYFDYWNNKIFELGSLGFGAGLISRILFSARSQLYSSLHLAAVPLAGNNTSFGPDTSLFRNYRFGGGMEAKIEETFHLNKFASIGLNGYYYWIHNYENHPGRNVITILKPRVIFNLSKTVSFGMEHHIYYVTRYLKQIPVLHLRQTEQKFFIQVFLEDPGRKGRYH
jgi:hypothetical protein